MTYVRRLLKYRRCVVGGQASSLTRLAGILPANLVIMSLGGLEARLPSQAGSLTSDAPQMFQPAVRALHSRRSFVLLEAMLGVLIFTLGILALGRAVSNCLDASVAQAEDNRARLALTNRMAEIESGSVFVDNPREEKLKGMFEGITLKQERTPLKLKNEKDQPLSGLFNITLEARWVSGRQEQSKSVSFYVSSTR